MSSADPRMKGTDHAQEVRAAQIRLLYEQAPSALIATTINAAILVFVLWKPISKPCLLGWFLVCVLIVLTGMASGSIATLSPVRHAYPMFLVPALLPYMVRLVSVGDDVYLAMGGMMLLYIIMMVIISQRQHTTVAESLRLRFENVDLLSDLTQAKDRQEKVNEELAAQIMEKRRAQEALQEAYTELERRVRERTEELAQSEEALREADRRKDEFLAMLGHELRNPLAPISNAMHIKSSDSVGRIRPRRPQCTIRMVLGCALALLKSVPRGGTGAVITWPSMAAVI